MDDTAAEDYGRSFYAATAVAAPERPPLTIDLDVDVCVIGAGLAGLTTALEVARLGWSVAVLEAKRVAWSASGRNCGFVLPGFAADPRTVVERVGLDRARRLWTLSEAGVAYVRTLVRERELPGVQPARGWLDVSKSDGVDDMDETLALLAGEFGAAVEGWPAEQVRELLKSDAYFHALHFPNAFHIHPLNYAFGLAAAAEAAGVRIFEGTPAREIDPAGVRKRIATPSAMVRAGHVVLAGNVHMGELMPRLAATVLPITSTTAVTAPLGDRLREAIAYPGAVSDSRFANHHYRVVDGDRLLWCGEGTCFPSDPRKVAERSFGPAIAAVYPQLGPVEFTHAWNGSMAFALHRMPQIGEISPGLWVAGAFGGHGLNTTAIAGNLIARAIVENDDTWRQFEPWDLVWAGGTAGRLIQEGRMRVRNRRETIEARFAQRRDRKRQAAALPLYRHDDDAADPPPPADWAEVRAVAAAPQPGASAGTAYDEDGGPPPAVWGRRYADPSFGAVDAPEPPNALDWRRAKAIDSRSEEPAPEPMPDRPRPVEGRHGRPSGR
ncbi:FAD-binding oxidoreductase [Rhodoplanes sp. TEM]|uniref:FAD-binding oxidoreductase n=1 Tax=Rhodoplanes tepidamans TaxID=200616 RepID=A0ABT5JBW4_RHOTP|nr:MULTISPECIES: FAD-binding oxidoreductase [Rhodoplanes]MDC7786754.1 FAD-binding oxidoreductase [Rhodoplanes tepidamans]MDC7983760.1 FAD-binding oxidoreductase [Rhodoplanes sp. TEM]MDQ0358191.1 glycine/D-amino acid oxidase-like deaminating enzyme [Rhodoplanes tepidamans]